MGTTINCHAGANRIRIAVTGGNSHTRIYLVGYPLYRADGTLNSDACAILDMGADPNVRVDGDADPDTDAVDHHGNPSADVDRNRITDANRDDNNDPNRDP